MFDLAYWKRMPMGRIQEHCNTYNNIIYGLHKGFYSPAERAGCDVLVVQRPVVAKSYQAQI